jgi:hypothetical protein
LESDPELDDLLDDIKETQLDADISETIDLYISRVKAVGRFLRRKVHKDLRDPLDREPFTFVTAAELLQLFA